MLEPGGEALVMTDGEAAAVGGEAVLGASLGGVESVAGADVICGSREPATVALGVPLLGVEHATTASESIATAQTFKYWVALPLRNPGSRRASDTKR